MRKLSAFNCISLNGYYKGLNEDISWHRHTEEEREYSIEALKPGNILLFGRVTYELMAGYWTTQMALQNDPIVAKGMNDAHKIVFSRTLDKVEWNNTSLLKDNITEEVRKMKQTPGKDMTILGSGSIICQLADEGLVDEYQFMINPVALVSGTPIFNNMTKKLELSLTSSRIFKSGVVLLSYKPLQP